MIKILASSFLILSSTSFVLPVAAFSFERSSITAPKTRVLSSREMLTTEIDNNTVNETQEQKLRVITWDKALNKEGKPASK